MSYPTVSLTNSQVATTASNRPLVLNEGQIFNGQIKQLFPGQMAEVQIGSQKLYAKLEVPMKAGDSYFFQVSSVKPELQLKVVSGPIAASEGQGRQISNLMETMQLPKTNEMRELLSFVLKNKIPMTREGLLQAEALLQSVPTSARGEALASIQKIVELKLPLNSTVFQALFGVESKEGLHAVLNTLKGTLALEQTITPQTRESILVALNKMEKPFIQATGSALLGQSLMTLLNRSESSEARFATVQMLKGAELLPERTSLANLQQVLTSLIAERPGTTGIQQPSILNVLKEIGSTPQIPLNTSLNQLKMLVSADATLSNANKEVLTGLINRTLLLPSTSETVTQFIREFGQTFTRIQAESTVVSPFPSVSSVGGAREQLLSALGQQTQPEVLEKLASLVRSAEQSSHPAILKNLQQSEAAVAAAVDGKAVKEVIQSIVRTFGLNYEAGLLSRGVNMAELTGALKPQLLALMQDSSVSLAMRESAEMVVARMNGPLLASGETGVQHQLVMQVPLEFFGKQIDATLEWNGRMKEDGKIDPDFARILFYLDLHSLDQTIVDMQVQNRIVSVTIYNADENLKTLGSPMQESLKAGLEKSGYKLSGVFFKKFYEEEKIVERHKVQQWNGEQGVDFRI